jgi:FkbM family methyltransferase
LTSIQPASLNPWHSPDGLTIHQANRSETLSLYQEIFVERAYDLDGLNLPAGCTIFDVGANIGMFALFAIREWKPAVLICVEPVGHLAAICLRNIGASSGQVEQVLFADYEGAAELTFYPAHTVMSGRNADPKRDRQTVANHMASSSKAAGILAEDIDAYLDTRFAVERLQVPVTTLDRVTAREKISRIDLIKIDVEGDEVAVLRGAERSLRFTTNVVVETDAEHEDEVKHLLALAGLSVRRSETPMYAGANLSMIHGSRT